MSQYVLIVYKFLPQYRKPFFELLKKRLKEHGVELSLIYGDGGTEDRKKKDLVEIDWAEFVPNKIFTCYGRDLYWQPVLQQVHKHDLVIVEQASKLLVNYYLQLRHILKIGKFAFWGHGRNFQAKPEDWLAEQLKTRYSIYTDWWFVYNETSKKVVSSLGFSEQKITILQNSTDTRALKQYLDALTEQSRQLVRQKYGIFSQNTCVFCGGMYKDKKLQFLLDAAHKIKEAIPDFELVFIGAGPEQNKIESEAQKYTWIHYLGPKFEQEKVELFSICKLYLMPGLVGLGIIDSFCLGVPLITTDIPIHSPEIEYLINNENGVMTNYNICAYAETVIRLLRETNLYNDLKNGALASGELYSVENMVDNFVQGVLSVLGKS
jgi:glycosyltransferase involved in cell wall biosynthesis